MSRLEKLYETVRKQVTELGHMGMEIVFSSKFGHHGTFKMDEREEAVIKEAIRKAEEKKEKPAVDIWAEMPSSITKLRGTIQRLVPGRTRGKYFHKEVPEWWRSTGIPFASPSHPGRGYLSMDQLKELFLSAKQFYTSRTNYTENFDRTSQDTPRQGTSRLDKAREFRWRRRIDTSFRRRRVIVEKRPEKSRARRNLFGQERQQGASVDDDQHFMELLTPNIHALLTLCDQTEPISFTAALTEGEVSNLRTNEFSSMTANFCKVNKVFCVEGGYPAELIKQWDQFEKTKGSENDRPDMFPENQLFIVFEFADCGSELESYKFTTIQQAKSVLTQLVYTLAVAERTIQFEHRDLHWGNVLVCPTEKEQITFKLLDDRTVYIPLPDDSLFDGTGDYQFDIYREMKKENNGDWRKFNPHSNVLWIHYLADKLVNATKYPRKGRREYDSLREFRAFLSNILLYNSAAMMAVESSFVNS